MRFERGFARKTAGRLMVAVALACGAAAAQGFPPPPPPPDAIGVEGFAAAFNDKVVAGVPYSATITTEISQTLPDGNQIQQTTNGSVARDSQVSSCRSAASFTAAKYLSLFGFGRPSGFSNPALISSVMWSGSKPR